MERKSEAPTGIEKRKVPFKDRPPQEGSIGRNLMGVDISTASRRGKVKKYLIGNLIGVDISPVSRRGKVKKYLTEGGHRIGSTKETNIPGTNIHRGIVGRYERGELFRAYMMFRREIRKAEKKGKDTRSQREKFKAFREKATEFKKNIDVLNRQFYENQTRVHVEDPELGVHNIPIVTLDLNPPAEGEKDKRTPYFLVPTYIANPHQVAFFAESLALQGEKVHVMTYPEKYKMSQSSPEWLDVVRKAGSLRPYAKLAEKLIEGMGLPEVNLVGTSMGGPIVLEMSSDQKFSGRIKDLIVVDPPSLVQKNAGIFIADFMIREGFPVALDREQQIKASQSQEPSLNTSMGRRGGWLEPTQAKILAKAQINQEKLVRINPRGKFQVWLGSKSAITGVEAQRVLLDAEKRRREEIPGSTPMKLFVVMGARHQRLFSSLGIAPIITQKKDPEMTFIGIRQEELDNNGAQAILRGINSVPQA